MIPSRFESDRGHRVMPKIRFLSEVGVYATAANESLQCPVDAELDRIYIVLILTRVLGSPIAAVKHWRGIPPDFSPVVRIYCPIVL